jgi:hypothetical protein
MANTTDDRAIAQARAQLNAICELVAAHDDAREKGKDETHALEAIQEDPLAISVRSDWQVPGSRFQAAEYQILLCSGGPACRIIGDLDGEQPATAYLEYQDWFRPWREFETTSTEAEALIEYARCFYLRS